MFRKVLLTIGLLLAANVAVMAQGTLRGTVKDATTGEAVISATVLAKQDGQMVGGGTTDFDGMYTIKGLAVGTYDIEVSYVGYAKILKTGVEVKSNDYTIQNFSLKPAAEMLDIVEIVEEKVPVIEIGTAATGSRISSKDIEKMPGTSVESIVAQVGGVGYSDGGTSTARGEDGMVTQVGGVRTRSAINVPKVAIAEIQVILGGTPASIGESIGGTQIVTLKPPENKFNGWISDEMWLDYRLANNFMAYFTGPVWVKHVPVEGGGTMDRTVLGFRLTGMGSYSKFAYYRAKDKRYKVVKDEIVQELEQNPITYNPVTGAVNYAAEYLRDEDFVTIKRPTASNYFASSDRAADWGSYSIAGQLGLVFRFSDYSNLEVTTDFSYGKSPNAGLSPFNLTRDANNVYVSRNLSIRADYTQRFPDEKPASADATLPSARKSTISNVMFSISALYNPRSYESYNETFGDNVFRYGHIGTFTTTQTPSYQLQNDFDYNGTRQTAYVQNGWLGTTTFEASDDNPVLANYTRQLFGISEIAPYLTNFEMIRSFNGLINGDNVQSVYGLFSNVGVQNTDYYKGRTSYYYLAAKASATVGKHEIEMGFNFDRYNSSYYSLGAYSLWSIMRQSTNAHITQLDLDNPQFHFEGSNLFVDYNRLNGGGQTYFDAALREALGLDINGTDWVDIDRYDPEFYSEHGGVSMFSANELFNSGNSIVSYYGYDHTGEKYNGRGWSLDDFFDPVSKGHPKYQYLPAFSPIYMAGYVQDKFAFEDLIFNVGVRVDYYDGNQMVLKDPYLLYESYTVGDLRGGNVPYNTGLNGNAFANNAKDDWVVYVDDPTASTPTIRGYRSGNTWYNAEGVEVSSPKQVVGESGKPTPYRTRGAGGGQEIATIGNASGNKVSSAAFEDYKAQIVPMPRIAFSFPVGEKSQFKANYDIIARRPSGGWQANYLSYMYMNQATIVNNPNLKPERNTNYEISFQQALNDHMGISVSAYYKETRDLIQLVQYAGADPNQGYYSYDNFDFKTTKGLTFSYDLRRTNNVRISANYTLQYAEGTGLSTTTMSELIREGYTTLKMLNPISDDRRHEFKANVDFRYESGAKYNGPVIKRAVKNKKTGELESKEIRPFEDFGINFTAVAQSGRPYTKQFSVLQNTIVGSYRGARLPWGFYFDIVADKTFPIIIKDKDGNVKRNTMLNVALTVNNLFNIRNILSVFPATGNPDDNGYLSDPETQASIDASLDPQSYRDMYRIMLNNNYYYYNAPRLVKLGVSYSF
ncbi:MAG: TonB-dependent receptor [Bacteroidales bacterium]|nr:TonB-dependent receptor [Bacteroidales bacterium]